MPRTPCELAARRAARVRVDMLGPIDDLLVDPTVLPDREDQQRRPMSISSRRTRCSSEAPAERRAPRTGSAGKQLHGALQHLLEVQHHLGEVRGDRAALGFAQPAARRQRVDVVPVAGVGGDPAGRRVRVREVTRAPRARPSRCGSWRSTRRGRRARRSSRSRPARRSHVLLDDGVQHRGLACPSSGRSGHEAMIAGTLVPRVLSGGVGVQQGMSDRAVRHVPGGRAEWSSPP